MTVKATINARPASSETHCSTSLKWRSIAVWPESIRVGNVTGKNESDDTHDSFEAAAAVCHLLETQGFGGQRQVFPLETYVEPTECPSCGGDWCKGMVLYGCEVCGKDCCSQCSDTCGAHNPVCDECLDGGYEDGYRQSRDG